MRGHLNLLLRCLEECGSEVVEIVNLLEDQHIGAMGEGSPGPDQRQGSVSDPS